MIHILRYLFCCKKKNVYSVNNPQTHVKGKYLDFVITIHVKKPLQFRLFFKRLCREFNVCILLLYF